MAAEDYGAMETVEKRLSLIEDQSAGPPNIGQLMVLVDSLRNGTLNEPQAEAAQALRNGLLNLADL